MIRVTTEKKVAVPTVLTKVPIAFYELALLILLFAFG